MGREMRSPSYAGMAHVTTLGSPPSTAVRSPNNIIYILHIHTHTHTHSYVSISSTVPAQMAQLGLAEEALLSDKKLTLANSKFCACIFILLIRPPSVTYTKEGFLLSKDAVPPTWGNDDLDWVGLHRGFQIMRVLHGLQNVIMSFYCKVTTTDISISLEYCQINKRR